MDPRLEEIVAADEQGRAHLGAARAASAQQIAAAEARRAQQDAEAQRAAQSAVADEVRAIEEQARAASAGRKQQRERFVRQRAQGWEPQLEAAARLYARIIREGPAAAERAGGAGGLR